MEKQLCSSEKSWGFDAAPNQMDEWDEIITVTAALLSHTFYFLCLIFMYKLFLLLLLLTGCW